MRPTFISIPYACKLLDVTSTRLYELAAANNWKMIVDEQTDEIKIDRLPVEHQQAINKFLGGIGG